MMRTGKALVLGLVGCVAMAGVAVADVVVDDVGVGFVGKGDFWN